MSRPGPCRADGGPLASPLPERASGASSGSAGSFAVFRPPCIVICGAGGQRRPPPGATSSTAAQRRGLAEAAREGLGPSRGTAAGRARSPSRQIKWDFQRAAGNQAGGREPGWRQLSAWPGRRVKERAWPVALERDPSCGRLWSSETGERAGVGSQARSQAGIALQILPYVTALGPEGEREAQLGESRRAAKIKNSLQRSHVVISHWRRVKYSV